MENSLQEIIYERINNKISVSIYALSQTLDIKIEPILSELKNNVELFTDDFLIKNDQLFKAHKKKDISMYKKSYLTIYGVILLEALTKDATLKKKISHISSRLIKIEKEVSQQAEIKSVENEESTNNNELFFENGSYFRARHLLETLVKSAKKNIVIVDNYASKKDLFILKAKEYGVKTLIIKNTLSDTLHNDDIEVFNKSNPYLRIIKTNLFHDRFLILDNEKFYHLGTSMNTIGKRATMITRILSKTAQIDLLSQIDEVRIIDSANNVRNTPSPITI